MALFREANQVRVSLKMKLSNYAWYHGSSVISNNDDYVVLINVNYLDNSVRKVIPPVVDGVEIKTEVYENRKKL